jgi:prevent-host-death family protein
MIEVSVSEARESLSDLLGRVQHGGEDVTILKHGKPVAVMISAEAFAYYEALENAELARMADASYAEYRKDPSAARTIEEIMAEDAAQTAAE